MQGQGWRGVCWFGGFCFQKEDTTEKEDTEFAAATQQAKGGIHSETDRVAEWSDSQTAKGINDRIAQIEFQLVTESMPLKQEKDLLK